MLSRILLWAWFQFGPADIPYDGVDQDGNGHDMVDQDGDGHASTLAFGDDCDDHDPRVHPGATDAPSDGVDADCDGEDPGPPRRRHGWRTRR